MTPSILAILSALIPLLVWWIRRAAAQHDSPAQQHEDHRESIAKEIIHSDEAAANRSLDDDLDKLRTLQSDRRGQNSPPSPGE